MVVLGRREGIGGMGLCHFRTYSTGRPACQRASQEREPDFAMILWCQRYGPILAQQAELRPFEPTRRGCMSI